MVALSFYGIFRKWETSIENSRYKFFTNIFFALPPSSRFNLAVYFRLFCQTTNIEMRSLIRKEKITCENCGTQTTSNNIVRHKKRCSVGTMYCTQCPSYSRKAQNIRITILLRSTVPQNLISPSSVNFVIKVSRDFMLYVKIETLNTECRSDQGQEM